MAMSHGHEENWTNGLTADEAGAIAGRGMASLAKSISLGERRGLARTFLELDRIEEMRRQGKVQEAKTRRECREGGCFRECEVYWGKRCKRLGGRKIPRIQGELVGRVSSWT